MIRRRYSRLEAVEESRNKKSAILFGLLTVGVIVLLAFYGLPMVTKVASLFTGLRHSPDSENVDITPPAPPYFDNFPDATNKTPLEITGHVESGNTVVINLNGTENELITDSDGAFTTKLDLVKGNNAIFAYAKDPSSNKSKSTQTYTVLFDNEPPKITISFPADGASFYGAKQQNVTIKGTAKADSTLIFNDRLASVNDDGTFSYSYQLSEGENDLNIKCVDQAGNEMTTTLKLNFSP